MPDSDETSSVNSAIGSVQDSVFNKLNLFPLETEFVDFNASKSSNNNNNQNKSEQIKLNNEFKIPDVTVDVAERRDSNNESDVKKNLNSKFNKLGSSLLSLKPFSQTIHAQVSLSNINALTLIRILQKFLQSQTGLLVKLYVQIKGC